MAAVHAHHISSSVRAWVHLQAARFVNAQRPRGRVERLWYEQNREFPEQVLLCLFVKKDVL